MRFPDELAAMNWMLEELRAGRGIPLPEARAVVRLLNVALNSTPQLPLETLERPEDYTAKHALNVSLLAMAVAQALGYSEEDVVNVGVAGLLHDVGTALVPFEVLGKTDTLSEEERARIKQHPIDGTRALLAAEDNLDLAAVVAYEHHIRNDGGGYPAFTFPRGIHIVSRLVQICDVYDAIRTERPYKKAWPADIALSFIQERAGFEFNPEMAQAFARVARERIAA